ncbi:hypothetical protein VNO77_44077 [Canavalia gladiata]|uniref:Uncharacterized protein n=1 Tax=Canavalia gladiata TaxID=3824 RepID=A0AAN9PNG7_CANGL
MAATVKDEEERSGEVERYRRQRDSRIETAKEESCNGISLFGFQCLSVSSPIFSFVFLLAFLVASPS